MPAKGPAVTQADQFEQRPATGNGFYRPQLHSIPTRSGLRLHVINGRRRDSLSNDDRLIFGREPCFASPRFTPEIWPINRNHFFCIRQIGWIGFQLAPHVERHLPGLRPFKDVSAR
jgi:hypothetical protein